MKTRFMLLLAALILALSGDAQPVPGMIGIRSCGVLPENSGAVNTANLQKAIDAASKAGGAIFVEPSEEPYPLDGGLVLRTNVSLIGVHGPTPRGTRHPEKAQPVGSVFRIEDSSKPLITVESATQVRGIQFWYPKQTTREPKQIVEYPATIAVSKTKSVQGVTLSNLTFYGEFVAMDFAAGRRSACELILIEHCYGYPLSGQFVRIGHCYDVPRILHCHVNPAVRRLTTGQYSKAVVDSVVARKTFAFWVENTDNAQVIDVFTFGTYGGIYLGAESYGQLTNFNFDCVTVGIHKLGSNSFNRNWQIAQGSIIANVEPGGKISEIHPIIIEGRGHTAISNVESFSGPNGALTTLNQSQDFLLVRGKEKLTVSLLGCRMRNYVADAPITSENPMALIQAVACVDKHEEAFNTPPPPP